MRIVVRRLVRLAVVAVLALGGAAVAAPAQAAAGCSPTSNHAGYATYNCYMYRSSVHVWHHYGSASYHGIDNTTGILYQGTSWFVCQRRFPVRIWYGSAANDYWAYTLSDNGWWGWVNAVYISGGVNWGPIPGLAGCPSGFGESAGYPGDRAAGSLFSVPIDGASRTEIN
jgi:hypothetical protein